MPVRDVYLGRLGLPTAFDFDHAMPGNIETVGASLVPGELALSTLQVTLPMRGQGQLDSDPYAAGMKMRRQAEALMANKPLLMQGLYLALSFDPESNRWIICSGGNVKDAEGGVTFSEFNLELADSYVVGQPATHRPAKRLDFTDRRLLSTARDYLKTVYSTDFASVTAQRAAYLPYTINDLYSHGERKGKTFLGSRVGERGTIGILLGPTAADVVSYEQVAGSRNVGDVVLYDRGGAWSPTVGPTRVNIVHNPSPTSGGSFNPVTSCTVDFDPTMGRRDGDGAIRATALAAGVMQFNSPSGELYPATPGQAYRASVQAMRETAGSGLLEILWYDSGGNWLGSVAQGPVTPLAAKQYGELSASGVAPASTASMRLRTATHLGGSPAAVGERGWVTDLLIEKDLTGSMPAGRVRTGFFSGNTIDGYWVGIPYAVGATSTQPDDPQDYGWEELYGPNQPLESSLVPVMDNGLVRIRPEALLGFKTRARIDAYVNGAWSEQAMTYFYLMENGTFAFVSKFYGASVVEWTPERAVVKVLGGTSTGGRAEIYLTLQRGWLGPKVEIYGSHPTTTPIGAGVRVYLKGVGSGGGDPSSAWVGGLSTGSGSATPTAFRDSSSTTFSNGGAWTTFSGAEPWAAMQTRGANRLLVMTPTRASDEIRLLNGDITDSGYDATVERGLLVLTTTGGYVGTRIAFADPGVLIDAKDYAGSGGTTVADATAASGSARNSANTADSSSGNVVQPSVAMSNFNTDSGKFGVWVRARATTSGDTASLKWIQGTGTAGPIVTTTSTTYVWLYLGEVDEDYAVTSLYIRAWRSAGAGTAGVNVDRVAVIPTERRTGANACFDGARDLGAESLYEMQVSQQLVTR